MPQVSVIIDGKTYRMACDEGQEEHLADLAQRFDRYVTHLKGSFGEIGDQRLTVMAGIMVTDELAERERRLKALEDEVAALRDARSASLERIEKTEATIARSIGEAAGRIEAIADGLSRSVKPAES